MSCCCGWPGAGAAGGRGSRRGCASRWDLGFEGPAGSPNSAASLCILAPRSYFAARMAGLTDAAASGPSALRDGSVPTFQEAI